MSTNFLNFAQAMEHLRWGEKIARRPWQTGSHIQIDYNVTPPVVPRIVLRVPNDGVVIEDFALPSRHVLAEDWFVVT